MFLTLAQLNPTVGALKENADRILSAVLQAKREGSRLILTSELALVGYPPLDLLFTHGFLDAVEEQIERICKECRGVTLIFGTVQRNSKKQEKFLFNSACVIQDQHILGYYNKELLPTYDVFDERRFFEPGSDPFFFTHENKKIALTICEDLWCHSKILRDTVYKEDPIAQIQLQRPDLLLNLSASPYSFNKVQSRLSVVQAAAKTLNCPAVLCNQVGANDGLLFDGQSLFVNALGELRFIGKAFKEEIVTLDLDDLPSRQIEDPLEVLYKGLVVGVRDYFHKTGFKRACLGLSGGIDSALVAYIATEALGKSQVTPLFMPSRYTHPDSQRHAQEVAEKLGLQLQEVSIEPFFETFLQHLPFRSDLGDQNVQARLRGMILMALCNAEGLLLLNTSNKSEIAMGYSTLYGDTCGAIGVLGDVYKTQVYALARLVGLPEALLKREPTAELKPNQKDTDTLPEYPLLDPIIADIIEHRLSAEEICKKYNQNFKFVTRILKEIFKNEYKRRQIPFALRVSEKALSPSVGRNVPIAQKYY